MGRARSRWPQRAPRPDTFAKQLERWLQELSRYGTCNVLMSDARVLYAYCTTKLYYLTRRAPFKEATLIDAELTVNFKEETTPNDVVTIIATQPLTEGEAWIQLTPGHLYVFAQGERAR